MLFGGRFTRVQSNGSRSQPLKGVPSDIRSNRGDVSRGRRHLVVVGDLDGDSPEKLIAETANGAELDWLHQHVEIARPDDDGRATFM
jgi:hypothetical protein